MLRITVRGDERKGRIEAADKIGGPWVAELENAWRSVQASGKELEIDLKDVTSVDEAGRELLQRMHRAGARLLACGVMMTCLVEEISRPQHCQPESGAKLGEPHHRARRAVFEMSQEEEGKP
jgi:hypothetical protein